MTRLFRLLARNLRATDLRAMDWIEQMMTTKGSSSLPIRLPLIAIVGPPRSGSTLLYQILVSSFDVFHFDNLQHSLLRYPHLAYRLSRAVPVASGRSLESDHGFVQGLKGPSEANFFWPYWLDMSMVQKTPKPSPDRLNHAASLFNQIHVKEKRPLVTSFKAHAFYMKELDELFEKVLFIHIRRERITNAVSILRARRKLKGDPGKWWSHMPERCRSLSNSDPYVQVLCQIESTHRQIRQSRHGLPPESCADVEYETLCRNTHHVVRGVERKARGLGIDIKSRRKAALPVLTPRGLRPGEEPEADRFRALMGGSTGPPNS